jgi:glutamyl-tRNA(Gln) amidotransferase subunit E
LNLPEPAEKKLARLMKDYGLNEKLAKQLIDSEYGVIFEVIVKESSISATTVAAFLTETAKALKREGIAVENVSDVQLREIFRGVASGLLAKEAVSDVFSWLSRNEDKSLQDALNNLDLRMLTNEELENLVERVIAENKQSVEKMEDKAFGLIMGLVMKEVRGKADPANVSKLLRERLR